MSLTPDFNTVLLLQAIRQIPISKISANEKYLLMFFLSCMKQTNDMWHGMKSIVTLTGLSLSTVRRCTLKLKNNQFITITEPDHFTHRNKKHYHLNINYIMSFHANFSPKPVDKLGVTVTPNTNVGCQADTRLGVTVTPDWVSHRHPKKRSKKKKKCVREKKSLAHPTHTLFHPSEKHKLLAKELGLDFDYQLEKFLNVKKGVKNDWTFSNWLKESKDFMLKESGSLPPPKPEPSKITYTHIQPDDFVKAHTETVRVHLEKVWSTLPKPNREVK